MATQPQSEARLAFGPFEVDPHAGELLKSGVRIRLSGQPLQILSILLAHPGEVVTRQQLREQVWGEGTFVDFEHGLNAAINRLRRALSDSPDNPRYIETVPGKGYRFVGTLAGPPAPIVPAAEPVIRHKRVWWWLAAAAVCLVSCAVWWRFYSSSTAPAPWKLTRLTADAGLSDSPALSRDGKLLAYSSDRGPDGGRDLYVKQVSGGEPIRLTFDGARNAMPDFSPDGSQIVFHSNRDGGGVYLIPAFGGEMRLLAREGLNPKISPDGSQVAYWVGSENVATTVPGSGAVWVVSVAGGLPERVAPSFTDARVPIWSPDGKSLLLMGYTSDKAYDSNSLDWWLAPKKGGDVKRTGALNSLVQSGVQVRDPAHNPSSADAIPNVPIPSCWSASNRVIFSWQGGDTWNLWETEIAPDTGRVSGGFKRLTAGAGNENEPSCAWNGALAFTNLEKNGDVWSFPFDAERGKATGALQPVTQSPAKREHAALSGDGRYVAFSSNQSGPLNIWKRDLNTGEESRVAPSSFAQRFPMVNATGSKVTFSSYEENGKRVLYVSDTGVAEKLCEGCLRATDWSRDEKTLLIFTGNPYQISLLDVGSHSQTPLVKHRSHNLLYARFSPDNRWISFTERTGVNSSRILIAPIDGPKPVPESAWIKISEEHAEDWANWSPDGKTLYFTSARDGHFCLWAQRIEASSHQPVGAAFAVQHLHGRATYQQGGWSAAGDRVAMMLAEDSGNIWMMSRNGAGDATK